MVGSPTPIKEDEIDVTSVAFCVPHSTFRTLTDASILCTAGIDNLKLTYFHKGRPQRPTINEGGPCKKLFG